MTESARHARRRKLVLAIAFLVGGILLPAALATVGSKRSPELVGALAARHSDDFLRARSKVEFVVQADGKTTPVRVSPKEAGPLLGKRVKVGFRADGSAELAAADGSGGGTTTSTAAAGTERKVAVILMNFSNDTRQPWTVDQVRAVAFSDPANSVAAYYRQSSWDQFLLSGDVFGWFTITDSSATGCDYSAWATSASAAAAAAGVTLSNYQHVVYAFPSVPACGWSGLAYLPGRESWLNNSGTSLRAMAHELGHNFGTHHASTLNCTTSGARVSLSATASDCSANEYGDPFSVMGSSSKYEPTNVSRGNFGWLQSANTQTVTAGGDYVLKPISAYDPTGVQVLRVKRTASTYLTLELRQNDGSAFDSFASTDSAVNGVSVRIATDYSNRTQSQLVDTTPATTSFGDAPLAAGRTLVDPLTGISITTLSVAATGATVRISFTPDSSAPTAPGGLAARALDTSRITLTWNASSDDVGVTGYRVFRGTTLLATMTGTSYTDTGLAADTSYSYRVLAFDAAGNTSAAATATATTLGADTQAPTQPGSLTALALDASRIALAWTASSDNVGVTGYRVLRGGTVVAAADGTSYTDTGLAANTTYGYQVVAVDAAGNTSAAATASATTAGSDGQAPSAPGNLTAQLAKGKKAALSWSPASDNVAVAGYRIFRNGAPVATTGGTSYTDALGGRKPSATYYVVAFDAAGNVGPPSASVNVG
jgi:chitodextrinase